MSSNFRLANLHRGLFVNHVGVSPLHYLRLIRLERARQSLERGASVTCAGAAAAAT